ncbi:CPG_1a_G0000910.mRNA.1.CDS.1 [Saccharomyces cerevisiae]|nr:CPG_1a_G0000910.mRNA.1.CDS.1 [Saccharomyces cerevisiae]CAI7130087.1 CPG_1a_G0000910.mRNA.1.CDS.1 [Saccharomyces cerevisiae]
MYKITTIYLWLKSYLSFVIGLDNLDFLTLIRFFSMSFTKQARFARYPGLFFCNLCGHSMVRTCNMVEAAQKQNRITFGSIYVKLHPLVKLCTGIVWAPRV